MDNIQSINIENTIQQKKPQSGRIIYLYSLSYLVTCIMVILWNIIYNHNGLLVSSLEHLLNYEWWRLIGCQYEDESMLVGISIIIFSYYYLIQFENNNSTVILMYEIIAIVVSLNIYILGLQGIYYYLLQTHLNIGLGLATILINFIFKMVYYHSANIWKWKIIIGLLIICCILTQKIRLDMLLSITIGLIECYWWKGGTLKYTLDSLLKMDNRLKFVYMNKICGYVEIVNKPIENQYLTVDPDQFYLLANGTILPTQLVCEETNQLTIDNSSIN